MPYANVSSFIKTLEDAGELTRVKGFVSPRLEIAEITDRFSKHQGKALLFEDTGTGYPVLINAMGSEKRVCLALGVNRLDDIGQAIRGILETFSVPRETWLKKLQVLPLLQELSSWMPKQIKGRGACQEVVMEKPDLARLPVLTCWPYDGGPFITLPCVHTKNPSPTPCLRLGRPPHKREGLFRPGSRNLGMYRMQVFGPDLTGMHWHLHKGSANHYRQYKELGLRMPVSVTLGGDPVYTYAATAPLPENLDEYLLAGFLRKKRVELVRCLTNELDVPADADFVIEGYVDPAEELILEGPFGDHTGFYSLADYFPRFHVTCITHRKDAVYPATIVGIPPMEDGWIGLATERIFLTPMKLSIAPELTDMHMPVEGVFHNLVLSAIEVSYPGQPDKVMNALWGAGQMMFNKIMVVMDRGTSLTDYREVGRLVSRNADPRKDILFSKGPVDILDHASRKYALGTKMGLDATAKDYAENPELDSGSEAFDGKRVMEVLPEIVAVNDRLPGEGILVAIFSVIKQHPGHIHTMARRMSEAGLIPGIRFVVFVDAPVDPADLSAVVWLGANNLDPERDCFLGEQGGEKLPVLFIDATRKTSELDGFEREWPNVIVMDDVTIRSVDERWESLGLGTFISSPSLRFKPLVVRPGALY